MDMGTANLPLKRMRWGQVFLIATFLGGSVCNARTIQVCKTCDVSTIQKAVALAQDGDEIRINKGTYSISNLEINKRVRIIGVDFPILDAGYTDDGLLITADGVEVYSLEVRNTKRGNLKDFSGIRVDGADNVVIGGVRLFNTFFGVYVSNSNNTFIYGNVLLGEALDQTSSGDGIRLWKCRNVKIIKNYIAGHRDGIYFEFAYHGEIEKNQSIRNLRYGLHFMFSDTNWFADNQFKYNGTGVAVMYSNNITMLRNQFYQNWGAASYGMLLKDIKDSRIEHNEFKLNTTALYFEGSIRVKVDSNSFIGNGWALKLLSSCSQDSFLSNNFIANTFDVSTNGTLFLNYFHENYWEKYSGYDINKDKIGDVPHRPVSMYAMMVENMPFVIFFMRSFMIDLLNKAEQNIPSLTPENVLDSSPRMHAYKYDDSNT